MRSMTVMLRGAVAALLAVTCAATHAQIVVTPETFGMHTHGLVRKKAWPSVPFGYLRLWDTETTWTDLEPRKGAWDFDVLDAAVSEAEKNKVKVLYTLGQTPTWAASDPSAKSPYGPGASSAPRDMQDWRNYVEKLATRYKGRIQVWELWNEANVKQFWSSDYKTLAQMEKIAAEVLKSVDPANVLVSASVQGGAFSALDDYFSAGGGVSADAIGYHFYALTEAPEALVERVKKVRAVMEKHQLGSKPLWNTEIGWLIAESNGGYGPKMKDSWKKWRKPERLEAAGFVARSYLLLLANGVERSFWYAWDNRAMGLSEDEGRRLKPAGQAYARTQEWLIGSKVLGCQESGGIWTCRLSRQGEDNWVVWSTEKAKFSVPAQWGAKRVQGLLDDKDQPVSDRLDVGPVPVLLHK